MAAICGFTACQKPATQKAAGQNLYFDMKGYFTAEASRLQQLNPELEKTVILNGSAETKRLHIADWPKELSIFTDADINKPSWKGEFTRTEENGMEVYRTVNPKIPVKRVELKRDSSAIQEIRILLSTGNYLYDSADTLTYKREIGYEIKKSQQIRLLEQKSYQIKGVFPKG